MFGESLQSKIDDPRYRCMYLQEGIYSFGTPFCDNTIPSVYTRVSSFLSWIQSIVWPAQELDSYYILGECERWGRPITGNNTN